MQPQADIQPHFLQAGSVVSHQRTISQHSVAAIALELITGLFEHPTTSYKAIPFS
ncbi:MAG: hypothetical protein KME05_18405 [Gloeocapsa sp. UFS-A4-WI-NPMV-4B04]|nr:hypothetical protein [Gloeocapsa sp. UFS-A4-WI-NPMV-4B04]